MASVTEDRAAAPADVEPAAPAGPTDPAGPPSEPAGSRRRRRAWVRRIVAAALVGVAVTGAGYGYVAVAGDATPPPPALGPGDVTVEIGIEHSLFDAGEIRVVEGSRVRFVVANDDPINHELITGPEAIHIQHANGTHPSHPSVPGEVSVGPGEVGITTFTFDDPGEFEFACHLPGHYEYGMHGSITVTPADA